MTGVLATETDLKVLSIVYIIIGGPVCSPYRYRYTGSLKITHTNKQSHYQINDIVVKKSIL